MAPQDHARRYQFLLDTAEGDELRAAHEWALGSLSTSERAIVAAAVQDQTLAGVRLTPDHLAGLARLLVASERRRPDEVLGSLPTSVRVRLHGTVGGVMSWDEAAYAGWEPPTEPVYEELPPDRGWDAIDDHQVYRFTHHSQEVIGGSQAVFRRRGG